jgi:hypothetical protein
VTGDGVNLDPEKNGAGRFCAAEAGGKPLLGLRLRILSDGRHKEAVNL